MTRANSRLVPCSCAATPSQGDRRFQQLNALSWKSAQSLKDLGELTARWLEGVDIEHPCYLGGGPDPETSPLVPDLVELNRSAFVTECSQPGRPMTNGSGQRAFLEGFCREDVARQVAELGFWTDLIVIAFPPGFEEGRYIPITINVRKSPGRSADPRCTDRPATTWRP